MNKEKHPAFFTSRREKKLWFLFALILGTLISTLVLVEPFAKLLPRQEVQAALFLAGMALTALCIFLYGLSSKNIQVEFALYIGIFMVFMLLFLRLGAAERSHLIEYSALGLVIHQIMVERDRQGRKISYLNGKAILAGITIGLVDECVQLLIPYRHFDVNDILFNGLAILGTIGTINLLSVLRKKFQNL